MNEVIISAGKSGRIMSGYTFTEKENDVLDKVKILDVDFLVETCVHNLSNVRLQYLGHSLKGIVTTYV